MRADAPVRRRRFLLARPGPEAAACDCLAADQQAYAELMR